MVEAVRSERRARRRPVSGDGAASGGERTRRYRHLVNPFAPIRAFGEDQVERMHEAALGVLESLGMRVLLPEARARYRAAGASVDEASQIVRLDRGLVMEALAKAPPVIDLVARGEDRNVRLGANHVAFLPVAGPPHVGDSDRGKRPGTLADYRDLTRLCQSFDVLHIVGAMVEAQDVAPALRQLDVMEATLTLSDKIPFVWARGAASVADSFAMVRLALGLDEEAFRRRVFCYTVVNTNSPLQLDRPMAQGIMDFAEAGQMVVVTPFTLAGAMAPITIPGALTQAHAEALAGIALAQITRPGAPVVYGSFTSNVDMRSGAPAFGTPEYVKAAFGAGQLARRIGLPWRSSGATASNAPDAQAAYETQMSLWGALMGGCNMLIHGAGWL